MLRHVVLSVLLVAARIFRYITAQQRKRAVPRYFDENVIFSPHRKYYISVAFVR